MEESKTPTPEGLKTCVLVQTLWPDLVSAQNLLKKSISEYSHVMMTAETNPWRLIRWKILWLPPLHWCKWYEVVEVESHWGILTGCATHSVVIVKNMCILLKNGCPKTTRHNITEKNNIGPCLKLTSPTATVRWPHLTNLILRLVRSVSEKEEPLPICLSCETEKGNCADKPRLWPTWGKLDWQTALFCVWWNE